MFFQSLLFFHSRHNKGIKTLYNRIFIVCAINQLNLSLESIYFHLKIFLGYLAIS